MHPGQATARIPWIGCASEDGAQPLHGGAVALNDTYLSTGYWLGSLQVIVVEPSEVKPSQRE